MINDFLIGTDNRHKQNTNLNHFFQIMIWQLLAEEFLLHNFEEIPIIVEKLSFRRKTILTPEDDMKFIVNLIRKSGCFEIYESGSVVCSGVIRTKEDGPSKFDFLERPTETTQNKMVLKKNDIYKIFNLKGQLFNDTFKSISECDISGTEGKVEWKGKYDSFLENILQFGTLNFPNCHEILFSLCIDRVLIDPQQFLKKANASKGKCFK